MGAKSGAALKTVQWFIRGIQLACAAVILGIYSYFLAALHNHDLPISRDVRAVEGISGVAVLYSLLCLLLLCCLAGIKFVSLIAIVLDLAFIGAFIYVAVANKHGASSCNGDLDTPFGQGQSGSDPLSNHDGFTALPSFHTACRLQTASLAVAIIAIFFFIFSIVTEVALARHHQKEKRLGPSPQNDYTSGYGKPGETSAAAGTGLFSRIFRRKNTVRSTDDNYLPAFTTPNEMNEATHGTRQSYATDNTAVNPHHPHEEAAGPYAGNFNSGTNYKYDTTHPGHAGYLAPSHAAQQTGRMGAAPNEPYSGYGDGVYDRV